MMNVDIGGLRLSALLLLDNQLIGYFDRFSLLFIDDAHVFERIENINDD